MSGVLKTEITHQYSGAEIDLDQFARLMDLVSWRSSPHFPAPGRTAWHEFDRPVRYQRRPGVNFLAAKLKGVGLWNPEGYLHTGVQQGQRLAEPIQPTTTEYLAMTRLIHVGISAEGELIELTSNPAPYGGILHERALLEFENAATLLEHNVPSIAPLAVVRYPDLAFCDKPMGAVVTASSERLPFRAHIDYLDEHGEEAKAYFFSLYRALGIDGDPRVPLVQWRAFDRLSGRLGTLLRGFAESGLYRYATQLENLHFDLARGELFLTDLDSSRRLDDLAPESQWLQVLRDIASALHKISWRLHYFVTLDPWPIGVVRKTDPFASFLRGYFAEIPDHEIERAVEPIWRLVIPHLFLRKRLREEMGGWDRARIRTYEVDRQLFYCLAMLITLPLLQVKPLARSRGSLERATIEARVARFLQPERIGYLEWLTR